MKREVRRVLLVIEKPEDPAHGFHNLVPLGPLGIVSFLESRGIQTDFVDLNVTSNFPDPSPYDAVGFSVTNVNVGPTRERMASLRGDIPDARIFVGGPESLARPKELFECLQPDAVIVGEAEPTIYQYLRGTDSGRVGGVVFRDSKGRIQSLDSNEWVEALDKLPFPALDRVDFSHYDSPLRRRRPLSLMVTSRGCPARCSFCYHSHGRTWRARSARNVVDEIQWQTEKLGVREIALYDDTFTIDQRRVSNICHEIQRRDLDLLLQARTRPDMVTLELLREMREAGLWLMGFGFESGNQATVNRLGKALSLQRGRKAVEWCRELGITTRAFFILGFPWEGPEEVENTIRFARELDADITQFTRLLLFPGTALYEEYASGSSEYLGQGFFSGNRERKGVLKDLDERFLQKSIKRAYHNTTMRPTNILRLMRRLPLSTFVHTTRFALATKNI